jgi:hypothetical protein
MTAAVSASDAMSTARPQLTDRVERIDPAAYLELLMNLNTLIQ